MTVEERIDNIIDNHCVKSNFRTLSLHIKVHIEEAISEEREACAKIADKEQKHWDTLSYYQAGGACKQIAQTIRGRNNVSQ